MPGGETEAISSCCGPYSPAAGLQQALLPRKPQHKTRHSLACGEAPSIAPAELAALGIGSTQHLGSSMAQKVTSCSVSALLEVGWKG